MQKVSQASILMSAIWMACLVGACSYQVLADETKPMVAHGLVCDTAEEVKAVISRAVDDMQTRLFNVNDHFGKEACNVVTVVFYKGPEESTMLIPEGIAHVVKVQVIGVKSGPMWLRMKTPLAQYTAILEPAQSA